MRRKPNKDDAELFALLQTLARDTNQNLHQIVQAYLSSDRNTFWQLSDGIVSALRAAHSRAAYMGRLLAGKTGDFGPHDELFGTSALAEQTPYLTALLQDLQAGRYGVRGETDTIAALLAVRLGMSALFIRGTANEAWGVNLPDGTMVDWVLGLTEHCTPTEGMLLCTDLAAGGPYPASAMPTWPGLCRTPCLTNCSCDARVVGGGSAFPPISL